MKHLISLSKGEVGTCSSASDERASQNCNHKRGKNLISFLTRVASSIEIGAEI